MKKRKIILFDIDHTLFDAGLYRKLMFDIVADVVAFENREKLLATLEDVYFSHREKTGGYFDIEFMLEELGRELAIEVDSAAILDAILADEESFQKSLFTETIDVMETIAKDKEIRIGVFSSGREEHQLKKLETFAHIFHKEHMHIFMFKDKEIAHVMETYRDDVVYLVDDVLKILYNAKKHHQNLITIWMKRGRLAAKQTSMEDFTPDYTVENLWGILPILKNSKS